MPKSAELTQDEVFENDIDPLEGIRALRKEGGASEEDLASIVSDDGNVSLADTETDEGDGLGELGEEGKKAEEAKLDEETESAAAAKLAADEATDRAAEKAAEELAEQEKFDEDGKTRTPQNTDEETAEEKTARLATEKETAAEKPGSEKRTFKANGQDFSFTQDEILEQFETVFGQAMDYTQKMQKIAPYRKMISALETQGVSSDQLNIAISALKGDTGALQEILKLNKIDNFDLTPDDDADPYQPVDYGKNDTQLGIEEITSKIENDVEYKITVDIIDQQWDNDSRETIANNPKMIQGLHNDIKTGVYDRVAPAAMKLKVLDGNDKSDIEYYMLAGEQLRQDALKNSNSEKTAAELNQQTQDAVDKSEAESSEADVKRKAGATGNRQDRKGVIDYLDDDDEKYEAWYKKLQDSN